MSKKDYYEVLGASKDASDADLKKAYRKLAMKYHPDRETGDDKKFKELNEAYEVLSDKSKRAAYDQYGHAAVNQGGGPGAGGFHGGGSGGFDFGDMFGDIFGDIFGGAQGGGGARRGQPGSDLQYTISLSLEEAVRGLSREIKITTLAKCSDCDGQGGKGVDKCGDCHGAGRITMQQGMFSVQQTCPSCRGAGSSIKDPCKSCRGEGRARREKTLSVKIPPGVDTGDQMRLASEGEAGAQGGPDGDLYIQIHVDEHPIFKRDGANLYCEVPIAFSTLVTGGEIDVPTLDGVAKLKIPHETQSAKMFRLRGKGVKTARSSAVGDLVCRVVVETPVKLTKEQKELLKKFQASIDESPKKHSPKGATWLKGVQRFFETLKS